VECHRYNDAAGRDTVFRRNAKLLGGVFKDDRRGLGEGDFARDGDGFEISFEMELLEQRAETVVPVGHHGEGNASRSQFIKRWQHVLEDPVGEIANANEKRAALGKRRRSADGDFVAAARTASCGTTAS
jgi:hypothetical protein